MRNCDLGLLPASNPATSSLRVSIGVMSTWSRAMRGFRRKGPRPYTAPVREGNWVTRRAHDRPRCSKNGSARSADNSTPGPAEDRDARDETICGYVLLANKYG